MENIKLEKKGKILTITVDLSKSGTPSFTGKSLTIASTKGNVKVEGEENTFVGLNVYKKIN